MRLNSCNVMNPAVISIRTVLTIPTSYFLRHLNSPQTSNRTVFSSKSVVMSHPQPYAFEVTQALLERARVARFDFGKDTAIVAVQHMLLQTVDLFRSLAGMGVNLKSVFALGKVYSNNFSVMKTLTEMGVTVVDSTMSEPGEFHSYFQHDINRLWHVAAETLAQQRIKRVIVLDDAGASITSVPDVVLRRYAVCAVEQTSSGVFLFEERPPPFAVIPWARASVKLEIGGPVFAHSFIEKLNTKFLHGRSLRGQQVGIVGLGSIGKGVANLAARQHNKVLFYDPNPDLQVPSSLHERITRVGSLEKLMGSCDYVFGCSGRNPFEGKWPLEHRPGAKLFSASGGDQEFGPIIRDLRNKRDFKVDPDTWDITSEHGPCGPIRIAYLGYPYNFAGRGPEAVPGRIVQLESGGLLAALMQARLHLDLCEKGRQDNSGIHRVSPRAQRFVYENWLRAMTLRNINLTNVFGHDPETLAAAQHDRWFVEKTEPHTPRNVVEERLTQIISSPIHSRPEGKAKPHLRTLRHY